MLWSCVEDDVEGFGVREVGVDEEEGLVREVREVSAVWLDDEGREGGADVDVEGVGSSSSVSDSESSSGASTEI